MNKEFLTIGQLKILAYRQGNEKKKAIIEAMISIQEQKYITKKTIARLEELGWEEKRIYAKTTADQIYVTKSKQIDVINKNRLRIGLGRKGLYDYNWLQIEVER